MCRKQIINRYSLYLLTESSSLPEATIPIKISEVLSCAVSDTSTIRKQWKCSMKSQFSPSSLGQGEWRLTQINFAVPAKPLKLVSNSPTKLVLLWQYYLVLKWPDRKASVRWHMTSSAQWEFCWHNIPFDSSCSLAFLSTQGGLSPFSTPSKTCKTEI